MTMSKIIDRVNRRRAEKSRLAESQCKDCDGTGKVANPVEGQAQIDCSCIVQVKPGQKVT